jgi:predicted phosphodiesterase
MTQKKQTKEWSQIERDIAIALMEENRLYKEISIALQKKGYFRSPEAVRMFFRREEEKTKYRTPEKDRHYEDVEQAYLNAISSIERKRQELFNIVTQRYEKIGNPKGKLHKIVSISDLHIPWVNDNVICDMMSKHNDAEILVINGDFLDQFSVSKWPKSKSVLLRHEYEIAVDYLKEFAKTFKKVILTKGNHDDRLESYFSNNLDPNVFFMTHPDMLERLARGYSFNKRGELEQLYDFSNVHYEGGLSSWYAKVGNCLFVHPKGSSKVPMKTVTNVADYFLEKEDFDAIVCAHTHKLGQIIWKGKMLIEQGCCCIPMDYEADAKMQYSQQAFGYVLVYMNSNGKVDFDKTRPVYYGTATAVDTDVRISIGD